ncbi:MULTISPECIES: excalibur calcium-binding domain-containing protein [Gordonia]|uniref:excalibur calcium-binding domain-containing protein n=1 Tax=Gordonia TaxID=2053 RepID=UPI00257F77FD|nr:MULTISPECIES: excalibur calcium-binding domain-containing protein [Gordonia]
MTGPRPYQPAPSGSSSTISPKAIIAGGVGAFFLMIASCGVGTAIGGSDSPQAAPTVTATTTLTETSAASNETVWRTTTVTATPTAPSEAAETTTQVADDSGNAPRGLVGQRTTTPTENSDSGSAYYSSCKQARAAGAAPLYAGQPGYSSSLDRDGDGVACE